MKLAEDDVLFDVIVLCSCVQLTNLKNAFHRLGGGDVLPSPTLQLKQGTLQHLQRAVEACVVFLGTWPAVQSSSVVHTASYHFPSQQQSNPNSLGQYIGFLSTQWAIAL